MPRSQQMAHAAAAAAAGLSVPPPPPPPRQLPLPQQAPQPNTPPQSQPETPMLARGMSARGMGNQSAIDYGKYRTKLCRNFMMGAPCPFENRCVFAHGEDQLARPGEFDPRTAASSTSMYSAEFPSVGSGYFANASSDDETPMSPPTYESFIASANGFLGEPASPIDGSDPATPIAPVSFRHDPYRPEGVVFKYF